MLPNPLHPAIVHFPIVLMVLLPLLVLLALVLIHRGTSGFRTWAGVVALNFLLVVSGWAALSTGESEEDRVEAVVAEQYIEEHEESAERFMGLSVLVLALSGIGLLKGRVGTGGRVVTALATLVLLVAGIQVGHSGGELVYKHGAGQVYAQLSVPGAQDALRPHASKWDDDDD